MNVKKEEKKEQKLFVLDTNVIVHDYDSIYKFQENDVCIPSIVLQELDNFKKGQETINVNVREFHRKLSKLREIRVKRPFKYGKTTVEKMVPALSHGGVSLGDGLGNIQIIRVPRKLHPFVKEVFFDEIPDHRIMSAVLQLEAEELKGKHRRVILVTKDLNLQHKADLLGIEVEDYENDKVPALDSLYKGRGILEDPAFESLITLLYASNKAPIFGEDYSEYINKDDIRPNMFFVIKGNNKNVLARVDANMEYFHKIEKMTISGITPKNAEQTFAFSALMNPEIRLVSLLGPAGTGKTLLAMAVAIEMLKRGECEQALIAAAAVTLGGKDTGALPGDAVAKIILHLGGLYDNLGLLKSLNKHISVQEKPSKSKKTTKTTQTEEKKKPVRNKNKVQNDEPESKMDFISILQKDGKIEIQSLAYIRGRSLNNMVFIVDEGQNLTPHEIKTIISRAGTNTKMIVCGDIEQIDAPYLDARSNGLSHIVHKLEGKSIVAHVTLEQCERSELASLAAELL